MSYEIFENIDFDNALTLFKLCEKSPGNLNNIKINYSRHSSYLQETMNFLVDLDVLAVEKNNVNIKASVDNFQEILLNNLLKNPLYCSLIFEFLFEKLIFLLKFLFYFAVLTFFAIVQAKRFFS